MAGTECRASPGPCRSIPRLMAEPFDDSGVDADYRVGALPAQLGETDGLARLT